MHLRNSLLWLLFLTSAATLFAQPQLHDLNIRVVLSKNGDARITETRKMSIDGQGTECYIGLGTMGPSTITDLTVSDENGQQFENIGEWDVDRSREWKTGKCGIVTKNDGYELCWGLGAEGERTYVTSYTMTGMVKAYPDADALRHVFLERSVSPKPEHAMVTIMGADSTLYFTPDTCGIWGFRFKGELWFEDGKIGVETTEEMNSEAALYIMAKFPKGMFEPSIQDEGTFEEKKQMAFEGSDYVDGEQSFAEDVIDIISAFGLLIITFLGWLGSILGVKKAIGWLQRKRHEHWVKKIDYCRTIPLEGNLQAANDMLNAYNFGKSNDYKRLISATVLQLIHQGAFSVKPVMTENGTMDKRFVVNEMPDVVLDMPLGKKLYEIFKEASGNDQVLDPHELETFMNDKTNKKMVRSFVDVLRTSREITYYRKRKDEVREVYGFKKFLDDFTLMNERHLTEVQLWRDYMVWATLYGNASQVIKDMKQINPEFFTLDQFGVQIADDHVLNAINYSIYSNTDRLIRNIERRERISKAISSATRSGGGGGHSSWGGGGGGFSGGGGGGGVR